MPPTTGRMIAASPARITRTATQMDHPAVVERLVERGLIKGDWPGVLPKVLISISIGLFLKRGRGDFDDAQSGGMTSSRGNLSVQDTWMLSSGRSAGFMLPALWFAATVPG